MSDVMDFLNTSSGGSGYTSVTFPNIGDSVKGVIVGIPRVVETPNLNTGAPEKKLVIDLQCDDGEMRTLWVRAGWMAGALKDAVAKAGVANIGEGGTLVMKYSANGEQTKPGFTPPKLYEAAYKPPTPTAGSVDDLLN